MDWQLRSLRSLRALRGFMPKAAFRSWKQWAAAAAGYAGLYLAWLLFLSGRSDWRAGVGHLAVLLPRLLAGGLAFSLYKNWWGGHRAALDPRVRQAWGLTGLALLLWLAGDLTRLAYEIFLRREAPVPSFADPVYLTGYFFAAAGLFSYPILPREHFGRIRFLLDMTITSAAALAVSWLVLIRPILITAAPSSPAEILWTSVYPLADLALLLILLNVSLGSGASPSPSALSFVAFGLAAFLVADLAYTYLVLQEEYVTGSPVSLGWVIGNCLFGLGALFQVEHPNSPRPASNSPPGRRLRHRIQAWLPLAATVALGWYTFLDWRATGQADVLSLWATALLGLALIARQGVIIGEVELQHYAHLVNNAADPAFICGPNGRLRLVNPALLSAIGYDHQEALLGRPLSMLLALSTLHPEEDLRPERLLEIGWSGEVTLHRRNGTEFPAYLSLRPVHSEVAARSALAGTIHDLTQVKRQQASLRAAYEQVATARRELEALNAELEERVAEKTHSLSEANKQLARQNEELQTLDGLKSEFVSLVSHELRAPLTTVSGGIELLLADPVELSSPVRDTLSLVQAHIQRLTQFVETILDLSALETGRLPVYPEVWDVSKIIQTIRDQFVASQVGKRLTLRLPPSLPPVLADERGLTSVIFHLIDNAIKYAPEGEVTMEAEDGGEWVRIHVSDQGPGIPPEAREKIFEKFERLDSQDSRSVYGHGLGLYMSRRLLQAMGGDIVAGEAPGGGARFTFWLPVVKEEKDHDQ